MTTEENLYTPDCIRTFSGKYVNVFEPTEEMIDINDIAHALANQCRFGGHLQSFFSVAQHSLNCFYFIREQELKLTALMHDASEAYLLDIPRPIKNRLANYKEIEDGLMRLIAKKFGFIYPMPQKVKDIDEKMLQVEWDYLMIKDESWQLPTSSHQEVKNNFLLAFKAHTSYISKQKE